MNDNSMEISFQMNDVFPIIPQVYIGNWKGVREREREYIGKGREGKKQGVLINFHSRVADNTNEASNEKCK